MAIIPTGTWPWAAEELGQARPEVMPRNEDRINFEKVAALRPDLIIGQYSGMTEADHARLTRIAPTVAQSGRFPDYGMPWQDTTRVIGRALGRDERADQMVAQVESRLTAAREANPQFEGRSAVVWNAGFTPQLPAALRDNAIYRGLAVAREGRDVFLVEEPLSGALTWSTVLSLPVANRRSRSTARCGRRRGPGHRHDTMRVRPGRSAATQAKAVRSAGVTRRRYRSPE